MSNLVLPDSSIEHEKQYFWIIAGVSNSLQWKRRYELAKQFIKHIVEDLKVNLCFVECAFGNGGYHVLQSHGGTTEETSKTETMESGAKMISVFVRNNSHVWLKENLQNIGVKYLPPSAKYYMFCDADIEFCNKSVVEQTIYALGTYKVVQPFETCCDLGNEKQVIQVHRSFGACHASGMEWKPKLKKNKKGHVYGVYFATDDTDKKGSSCFNQFHPGYACAMTRQTYSKLGGLFEMGAAGAGDMHMVTSFIGKAEESYPSTVSPAYRNAVLAWQKRAKEAVGKSFGFVHGTILHQFHGKKSLRKYIERWSIITKNKFDPSKDLWKNPFGVIEISNAENPNFHRDMLCYFSERNEDSTDNN